MSSKSKLPFVLVFGFLVNLASPLAHAGGEIRDMLAHTVSVVTGIALSDEIASKRVRIGIRGGGRLDCQENNGTQDICVVASIRVGTGAPEKVFETLEYALRNPCAILNQPTAEELLKATIGDTSRSELSFARRNAKCIDGGKLRKHIERLFVKAILRDKGRQVLKTKEIKFGEDHGK